jgi:hypothetical protein
MKGQPSLPNPQLNTIPLGMHYTIGERAKPGVRQTWTWITSLTIIS